MAKKTIKGNISIDLLFSKYKTGLASDILVPWEEEFFVPTKSPVVNYQLGGGFVYGRISEISGYESSGKSLLAMDAVTQAQALGGIGIWVDAEMAFSENWAKLNGIDLDKLVVYPENTIEEISDFVVEAPIAFRGELVNNEPIVLVVDSVAALDTVEAMNSSESDAKAEMGKRAKALYKMLRIRNRLWAKLGITVIFVNQLRDSINVGFGAQFKDSRNTTGGKAMKFYASQRIYLEAKKSLTIGSKERKKKVGIEVAFEMKKNKIAIPKATRRIEVAFDPEYGELGFSQFGGLGSILLNEGVISKEGGEFVFDGEEIGATSKEGLDEALENLDDEFLMDVCNAANIIITPEMEKRLDEETENRYPIDSSILKMVGNIKKGESDDE